MTFQSQAESCRHISATALAAESQVGSNARFTSRIIIVTIIIKII